MYGRLPSGFPVALAYCLLATGLLLVPAWAPVTNGSSSPAAPTAAGSPSRSGSAPPVAPAAIPPHDPSGPDSTTYAVTFSQSGLPCCDTWSVTIEGITLGTNSYGSQVFYLPNGTHFFQVTPTIYYLPSPASGNVTVSGGPTGVTILFYSPPTFPVQVNETGLPAGDAWTVTAHFHDVPGGQRVFTTTTTPSYLNLRSDTYTLDITGPAGYGVLYGVQTLVVAGAPVYRNVSFHVGSHNLTFEEVGLPVGTSWTVELAGHFNTSTTNTVVDFLNNGSYSYLVGIVPGYTATPLLGTALIAGYDDLVPIVFTPATFPVYVTQSGLPAGISWWITVNGTRYSSVSDNLTLTEPNGTYGYTYGTEGGYTTSAFSGEFTIAGTGASLSVAWNVTTYAVAFNETGLPSGTTWHVTIGNRTYLAEAPGLVVASLPNGSYSFTIPTVQGFVASPTNGSFTVAALALREPVTFNATGSASWLSTDVVPGVSGWVLVAGLLVVVGVAAAVVLVRRRRHH